MTNSKEFLDKVNEKLDSVLSYNDSDLLQSKLLDAMRYSISAGGKRVRPYLVYEFCKMCNGDTNKALAPACAIECIHTYSLIHDDLPAMDNDDFRRGKPSCHKKFGEYTAILAGDALNTLAFEVISSEDCLDSDTKVKLINELAKSAGFLGMAGGQQMDIEIENNVSPALEDLVLMYLAKTGALIQCACKMGAITAKAPVFLVKKAGEFGMNLGIAFQIIDDILDIIGDESKLGKPVGSDKESDKSTYASIIGIEEAKQKAKYYSDKALKILEVFPENTQMKEYTNGLLSREF